MISTVLFLFIGMHECYAQASLQEIVRFNIPIGEKFCSHVEAGGDINGDGRPDLVFSCIDELNYSNAPVYIYYSVPDSSAVPDQILTSPYPNEGGFGYSLAYKGDLNGDGISDLTIGYANYDYRHAGAVLIYYGGSQPFTEPDVFISGVGLGETHSWDLFFSEDLITDCDLNGDSINDLLVYAPGPQYENWGNVYAFLGGETFNTTPTLHIRGSEYEEYLGTNMKVGDINGDGYDDIVLTNRTPVNPEQVWGPFNYSLKIYLGGDNLSDIPIYNILLGSSPDFGLAGIIANGDLNGDGFDDILLSCADLNGSLFKVIYGQSDITELSIVDFTSPELTYGHAMSYCNLDDDYYSDFYINHRTLPDCATEIGNFCLYRQTSNIINLVPDYVNSGEHAFNDYGWGFNLEDISGSGFPVFFVCSYDHAVGDNINYATLLSEYNVSNSDEQIQPVVRNILRYPNPFRTGVNISLFDPDKSIQLASINIYNIKGQLVYNGDIQEGKQIHWNGLDNNGNQVSSGIYLIKATDIRDNSYTTKVVNIK